VSRGVTNLVLVISRLLLGGSSEACASSSDISPHQSCLSRLLDYITRVPNELSPIRFVAQNLFTLTTFSSAHSLIHPSCLYPTTKPAGIWRRVCPVREYRNKGQKLTFLGQILIENHGVDKSATPRTTVRAVSYINECVALYRVVARGLHKVSRRSAQCRQSYSRYKRGACMSECANIFTTEWVPILPFCNANNSADAGSNGVKAGAIHARRHGI